MSEINMKSDLLETDRCVANIKQVNRRQKMTKTSIFNGSGGDNSDKRVVSNAVNMVAAMQDHLSCTKSVEYLKTVDEKDNKTSLPYELDHMYANCSNPRSSSEAQQLKCIKELLFLHLDLIQQQQESLNLKERQLGALRHENGNLKQQLDDTKLRISILESENDKLKTELTNYNDRRHRNNNSNSDRNRNQSNSSAESPSKRIRPIGSKHEKSTSDGRTGSIQRKENGLQTEIAYYTPIGSSERLSSSSISEETVLVPCWRVRPIASCYQMEGTENLDDDIFLKRHQKLEIDEKRRKRWDIQRLREQKLQEKLKRGRSANKDLLRNRNPDLNTFYPRTEDVQYVEVSETIPVSAFGYPIPLLESSEFEVPWLNSSPNQNWSAMGWSCRAGDRH